MLITFSPLWLLTYSLVLVALGISLFVKCQRAFKRKFNKGG